MTNKEFIPYEQALELKELGFNEQCFAAQKDNIIDYGSEMHSFIYNMDCGDIWVALPLYQQAFRWFREKYNYDINVRGTSFRSNWVIGIPLEINTNSKDGHPLVIRWDYKTSDGIKVLTYEEAELACLKKLIEIVKNK